MRTTALLGWRLMAGSTGLADGSGFRMSAKSAAGLEEISWQGDEGCTFSSAFLLLLLRLERLLVFLNANDYSHSKERNRIPHFLDCPIDREDKTATTACLL